ncbi:MAG: hypothetical protein HYU42_17065, partial [Candidatus Rokubacteria bacterium]|nr:hypothetical protein [Candidatus Rokubacteria bacterium]
MTSKTTISRDPLLVAILLLVGLAGPATAAPKEAAMGAMARPEAGLAIAAGSQAPLAVQGPDAAGRPLFAPPDGASLFLAVDVRAQKGNKNGFG